MDSITSGVTTALLPVVTAEIVESAELRANAAARERPGLLLGFQPGLSSALPPTRRLLGPPTQGSGSCIRTEDQADQASGRLLRRARL